MSDPSGTNVQPDSKGTAERRAVKTWSAALVLLCLAAVSVEFRHIESTLPYPQYVDEGFIAGPARRTLETGTLHPYKFAYPSLPMYLAAGGMAVGFVRGAAHRDIPLIQRLGNVGYPYYDRRRPMQAARQLFAVLSVIALAATGASAWIAFRRPFVILLAPLILLTSTLYFYHSWTYLNVDIVGTCFVMLTVAACLLGTGRPSIFQSAFVPGVCAGLATASKYTLALVICPVLLAIAFHFGAGGRIRAWATALVAMAAAFLVAVPYSLIDLPGFLNGVAAEAFHYASGHRGWSGEPGLPQFLYYLRVFLSELAGGAILALVGIALYAAADWRRTAVLISFPAALLWLLAAQRVYFPRNALSVVPFVAMFAALGVVALHDWVRGLSARSAWAASRKRLVIGLVGVALIAAVPVWRLPDHLRDRTDSRNLAHAWIEQHIPRDWTIVVAKELGFDGRALEADGRRLRVVELKTAETTSALQALLQDTPPPAAIMVPRWGGDSRWPGHERAKTLNDVTRDMRVLETFGTHDVLVNRHQSLPAGDPAFAVAVMAEPSARD
jgi:hypothetical protein